MPLFLEDFHHRFEVIRYLGVVLSSIIQDFVLGLLKCGFFSFKSVPKVLSKGHPCVYLFAGVLLYHLDYLRCHLFLILRVILIVLAFVCKLTVNRMAFG